MSSSAILNKIMVKISDLSVVRVAMAGILFAGIYSATIYDNGSVLQSEIEAVKTQIEEEKVKQIETKRVLQKEEQMRADVSMMVKKYEEVKSKIPIEFLESELRIIIDQIASQNELKTLRNIRSIKGKDFGSSEDATLVEQVVLEYSFVGNFYSLEKLINQISKTDKLIKIENFEIVSTNKRTEPNQPKELMLNATLIGFKQSSIALNQKKSQTGGSK